MGKNNKLTMCIVGESGAGKSALASGHTYGHHLPTRTLVSTTKNVQVDGKNNLMVTLQVWDTPGLQIHLQINRALYSLVGTIVIAVDLSQDEKKCMEDAEKWYKEVSDNAPSEDPKPTIVFVGTKSDEGTNNVEKNKIALTAFAQARKCAYYTTSAKNTLGVSEMYSGIAKASYDQATLSANHANGSHKVISKLNAEVSAEKCKNICKNYINSEGLNKSVQSAALAETIILFCGSKKVFTEDEKKLLYYLMKPYMEAYGPEGRYWFKKEFATKYINQIYDQIKPNQSNTQLYNQFINIDDNKDSLRNLLLILMRKIMDEYDKTKYSCQSEESKKLYSSVSSLNLPKNGVFNNQSYTAVKQPILTAFAECVVNRETYWTGGPRVKNDMQFLADDAGTLDLLSITNSMS